ncbi:uncharacterized protein RCH25_036277 [Pelodytes ibericus]
MSAVAAYFKFSGDPDVTKEFLVRQALRGYRRGFKQLDSRRPVTFSILLRILEALPLVCSSPFENVLFALAFSWAFFGAFRVGELVSPTRLKHGGVLLEDVRHQGDSICVLIRRSKTDQVGKGLTVSLLALPDSPACPVHCLQQFLHLRPDGGSPLLVHRDGSAMSRFQFFLVFRKCLAALDLGLAAFGTHSFRIGAATEAARWGLGDSVVKLIGRWESARFKSYIRPHLV